MIGEGDDQRKDSQIRLFKDPQFARELLDADTASEPVFNLAHYRLRMLTHFQY